MTDNDLLSQWSNINYWRRLCPYLTIGNTSIDSDGTSSSNDGGDDTREKLLQLLINDGYALIDKSICNDVNLQKNVCRGITDMEVEHSLPATFILLFNETWQLARESYHLLLQDDDGTKDTEQQRSQSQKGILHRNSSTMTFNFDMLAWYIDPKLNQAGFSPHRDRQPDSLSDLKQSFYSDGQAKYVTHWIALADATPENSCLYVIPKACDPGYLQGDDMLEEEKDTNKSEDSSNNDDQSDPLSRALNTKQSYQNIRALPRNTGQSVIFTHRILHWGSKGNPNALNNHPRVAISFVYSDILFEAPYLSKESFSKDNKGNWSYPSFETRLLLVCAQLLIYYQRFNLSISTIRACYQYCKANSDQLDEKYKKKVFIEYVKAMKEQRDGISDCDDEDKKSDVNDTNCDREGANSDDEEALLEEMLNNSGDFEDDYDDMLDECSDNGETQPKRMRHTK